MGKKKDFKIHNANVLPVKFEKGFDSHDLVFFTNKGKVDFNRYRYLGWPETNQLKSAKLAGRDSLVSDLFNAIQQLSFEMSVNSVQVLASSGCKELCRYLDYRIDQGNPVSTIEEIDSAVIDEFLIWLRNRPSKTETGKLSMLGARRHYTSVKTVLTFFVRQGRLSKEIFPYAPFVNVNRSGKGAEPYSKSEISQIMRHLWKQVELIRNQEFKGSFREVLGVYALLIAAKTGRNTSTVLSLKTDCITAHPLSPDTHILLTGFKKRGTNTSVQAMRSSSDIEDIFTANKTVENLINEVKMLTAPIRSELDSDSLFLCRKSNQEPEPFHDKHFWKSVLAIYNKADLKCDRGQRLRFQVKRMRKTFATRVWQLTGGDPIKTSKMLGNTVPVMDGHYLDVTPEMERDHKLFGHVLTQTLLGRANMEAELAAKLNVPVDKVGDIMIGRFNTGVGRCSDPTNGKYAPKSGEACTRFAACFKCPNQVILESDLHRLYSFYWLLVKERNCVGRKKWKKLYAWIIRVIDRDVGSAFCEDVIDSAKASAKSKPHPMWRDRTMLLGV